MNHSLKTPPLKWQTGTQEKFLPDSTSPGLILNPIVSAPRIVKANSALIQGCKKSEKKLDKNFPNLYYHF